MSIQHKRFEHLLLHSTSPSPSPLVSPLSPSTGGNIASVGVCYLSRNASQNSEQAFNSIRRRVDSTAATTTNQRHRHCRLLCSVYTSCVLNLVQNICSWLEKHLASLHKEICRDNLPAEGKLSCCQGALAQASVYVVFPGTIWIHAFSPPSWVVASRVMRYIHNYDHESGPLFIDFQVFSLKKSNRSNKNT